MRLHTVGLSLVMGVALAGCGPTEATVCRAQCDKLAACGATVDLTQCHATCDRATASYDSKACGDADLAYRQCQIAQPCDAGVDSGCVPQREAMRSACP